MLERHIMTRSYRSFFSFSFFAVAALACVGFARSFLVGVVEAFKQPALVLATFGAQKVQACAYALGVAKRERPHVASQWRMCPST